MMRTRLAAVTVAAAAIAVAVLVASPWASGSSAVKPITQISGYAHTELGPVNFTPTPEQVSSLSLPAGKYLVSAKLVVRVPTGPADITCTLAGAGGAQDQAFAQQLRGDANGAGVLALASPATLASAGAVSVSCRNSGGTTNASNIVITAIRVTSLRATASG